MTLANIHQFFNESGNLKTRVFNPSFPYTIELVTKALLYYLNSKENIDQQFTKMKGEYFNKTQINFKLDNLAIILAELKTKGTYRYQNQIDFFLNYQEPIERNPYTTDLLKRSGITLSAKIIFKDFKAFLSQESNNSSYNDPLFISLKGGNNILFIDNFGEIWYHHNQIYSISHIL